MGYETDYYDVTPGHKSGVGIRFSRAVALVQGKKSRRKEPSVPLFNLSANLGHVRLVYLIRVSQHDHDMVLVAAADAQALHALTAGVMANSPPACKASTSVKCVWIPAGIAVVPEQKKRVQGRAEWVPAQ